MISISNLINKNINPVEIFPSNIIVKEWIIKRLLYIDINTSWRRGFMQNIINLTKDKVN